MLIAAVHFFYVVLYFKAQRTLGTEGSSFNRGMSGHTCLSLIAFVRYVRLKTMFFLLHVNVFV